MQCQAAQLQPRHVSQNVQLNTKITVTPPLQLKFSPILSFSEFSWHEMFTYWILRGGRGRRAAIHCNQLITCSIFPAVRRGRRTAFPILSTPQSQSASGTGDHLTGCWAALSDNTSSHRGGLCLGYLSFLDNSLMCRATRSRSIRNEPATTMRTIVPVISPATSHIMSLSNTQ